MQVAVFAVNAMNKRTVHHTQNAIPRLGIITHVSKNGTIPVLVKNSLPTDGDSHTDLAKKQNLGMHKQMLSQ